MQAFWIQSANGATSLERRDVAVPQPGPGQVLVRMHAAGLNRGEIVPGRNAAQPKPGGAEGAGEVVVLGEGVTGPAIGSRVMGRCNGAFAEYAVMDAREAIGIPQRLSWEQAASIPLAFAVVHDMLIAQGRLAAGEWLLVTGISSGVGVAALQVAKMLGAKVIGTSGSAEKLERLKALGLDVAVCTRSADWHDAVMAATGTKGANLIVNNVGGSMFGECVRSLAFQGRLATVGSLDGVLRAEMDIEAMHGKRLTLFGVSNRMRSADQRAGSARGVALDILPAVADGSIQPLIDRTFAFDDLPAAKAYMESNAHLGKIVVQMPGKALLRATETRP
jgi:NADPH:quinone reductase-like Zn-dependent oxidoreductase